MCEKEMIPSLEDMIEYLEEYYECAGFANYWERVLDALDEEGIRESYYVLKETEEHPDLLGEYDSFPQDIGAK